MKILRRYIGRNIISSILVVLVVLIGMDLFIQFLNELDDIGQGNYTLASAFLVAFLRIPQSVYEFFPMAGLIGSLLGLGNLASNSELIVMRSAGVSSSQIAKSVMMAAVIIMVIVTFLGEVIAPNALRIAELRKAFDISGGQTMQTLQGAWLRDGNTFIYVNRVLPHNNLRDIKWYTLGDHDQLAYAGVAKSATFRNDQWVLQDASRTQFLGMQQTKSSHFDKLNWHVKLNPKVLTLASISPDEMSLNQLYKYIRYRQQNRLQASQYSLAFWQRVLAPIATLVMIFLAIPFIFGPLRTVTMGLRIVAGVGAGLVFYFANQLFGPFSMVYQMPPLWAALIPILFFALIGVFLMIKTK